MYFLDVKLPSGREFRSTVFESVILCENPPLIGSTPSVTVKVKKGGMTLVTRHQSMEEAELSILALSFFCEGHPSTNDRPR